MMALVMENLEALGDRWWELKAIKTMSFVFQSVISDPQG